MSQGPSRPRSWSWLPLIGIEQLRTEANPRYFFGFHLPFIVAAGAVFFIPAVQRISGVEPLPLSLLLGLHLLTYGLTLSVDFGDRRRRRVHSLWVSTLNVFATAGGAMLCANPWSPLWATYLVYPYVAARAFGATVYLTALFLAAPTLAGLYWAAEGRVPFGHGLGMLVGLGSAGASTYLLLSGLWSRLGALERQRNEQAERASRELERTGISTRVHATIGAALREVARWQRAALEAAAPDDDAALAQARRAARAALDDLRLTVSTLQGEATSALGFEALLRRRLERLCEERGALLELSATADSADLSPVVAYRAARIVEEATANALRHGKPRAVRVTLRFSSEWMLRVEDDGEGFEPGTTPQGGGLEAMREHADALGATVELLSRPGQGTVVCVRAATAG